MPKPSVFSIALFAACLAVAAAPAGDDIGLATEVWNGFVASVRRGDYPDAHRRFSAESRSVMPYAEFVSEYGPLSAAREMVLARPESLATRLDGDWAEISYGGVNPGSGRRFKVGVSLVKNEGAWGLVAARNEKPERVEAEARSVLRAAALWRGNPDAPRLLDELQKANADSPMLRYYRFETDGRDFRAVPLVEGLRGFHVDAAGEALATVPPSLRPHWELRLDDSASAPAPAPVSASASAGAAPALGDLLPELPVPQPPPAMDEWPEPPASGPAMGLPELTEPPLLPRTPSSPSGHDMPELPEPREPPSPRSSGDVSSPLSTPRVRLPDSIG